MNLGLAERQVTDQAALKEKVNRLDKNLELTFSSKSEVCQDLSRVLVSFQGNIASFSFVRPSSEFRLQAAAAHDGRAA